MLIGNLYFLKIKNSCVSRNVKKNTEEMFDHFR